MNSREIVKPTGNIEIHPLADNGEGFFPPGTEWRVDSGYTFHFTDSGNLTVINPAGEQVGKAAVDLRIDGPDFRIEALWQSTLKLLCGQSGYSGIVFHVACTLTWIIHSFV